jgi:hypothetical protein
MAKGPSMNSVLRKSGLLRLVSFSLLLAGVTDAAMAQSAVSGTAAAADRAVAVRRLPLFVGGSTLRN